MDKHEAGSQIAEKAGIICPKCGTFLIGPIENCVIVS